MPFLDSIGVRPMEDGISPRNRIKNCRVNEDKWSIMTIDSLRI